METSGLLISLEILAVFVLVLVNGFFVAAEFALVKIRTTQLQPLIAKGTAARSLPGTFSTTWTLR